MKLQFFILLLLCNILLFASCESNVNSNHILKVSIKGIDFDSLFIYNFSADNFSKLKIDGEKKEKGEWLFSISDSIYENLSEFELIPQTFDYSTNTSTRMIFQQEVNGKLYNLQQLNFNDSLKEIMLNYKEEIIYDSVAMSPPNGKFVWGKMKMIYFTLEKPIDNPDFLLRMDDPYYSMFLNKDTIYPYHIFYEQYLTKAKQNPGSRYYISRLASRLNSYKTKEDINCIYNCFTDKLKQSSFGKKIKLYIDEPVPNEKLVNTMTAKQEYVISDSSKYTMIIFSASWCNPCHRQLPLQKEIYNKLKGKLNLVTVSIDDNKDIEKWKYFVKKNAIPWKTLICNDAKSVREKYKVPSIPHCKLVHPGLKDIESFDLWNENDVKRLYEYFYEK